VGSSHQHACYVRQTDADKLHTVLSFSSVQVLVLGCQGLVWEKSDLPQALNLLPVIALTWKHGDGYGVALKRRKREASIKVQKGDSLPATAFCVLQLNQVDWLIKSKNCI